VPRLLTQCTITAQPLEITRAWRGVGKSVRKTRNVCHSMPQREVTATCTIKSWKGISLWMRLSRMRVTLSPTISTIAIAWPHFNYNTVDCKAIAPIPVPTNRPPVCRSARLSARVLDARALLGIRMASVCYIRLRCSAMRFLTPGVRTQYSMTLRVL